MSITRREILSGAAGLAALGLMPSSVARADWRPRSDFRFVHLTDLHVHAANNAALGVTRAVNAVLSLDPLPNFVLFGGDMVYDGLAVTRADMDRQTELLREALSPLKIPAYYTVGNHDAFGWNSKGMISKADPLYGKAYFQEKISKQALYYSFDYGGWHFIVLDSVQHDGHNYYGEIDQEQFQWLRDDLEKSGPETPKIVSTHIPFFTAYSQFTLGTIANSNARRQVINGKRVHDLFRGQNVQAVFQGHTHIQEEISTMGTKYISGGSVCGEWWRGKRLGMYDEGFTIVDCTKGEMTTNYVPYGWQAAKSGEQGYLTTF